MTSSAERGRPDFTGDFLAFTLAGGRPAAGPEALMCANGVRATWLDDGILQLEPSTIDGTTRSVLVSAGIHGDETAPIELLSFIVRDIASGALPLACRLLIVLGNIGAMRTSCRYVDDDLNRLFSGKHAQLPQSHEAPRAAALEKAASEFFAQAACGANARWHVDMHT